MGIRHCPSNALVTISQCFFIMYVLYWNFPLELINSWKIGVCFNHNIQGDKVVNMPTSFSIGGGWVQREDRKTGFLGFFLMKIFSKLIIEVNKWFGNPFTELMIIHSTKRWWHNLFLLFLLHHAHDHTAFFSSFGFVM